VDVGLAAETGVSVRLRVEAGSLVPGERVLSDGDYRYLARVHRLAPGDGVTLFDGAGVEAPAEIVAVDADLRLVRVRVGAPCERTDVGVPLTLVVGLSKGDKMDLVVQKTTELGVAAIAPVACERSVVRLEGARAVERQRRWEKIAAEAARQCGRTTVPLVLAPAPLERALAVPAPDALRLILHERAGEALARALPAQSPPSVVLAVGPEGGFSEAELAAAREQGFRPVLLGPRILRAETAAIAAVVALGVLIGDLV
jgi:16S rRNA (uracil1498-N3)-methyltransferase